MTEEEKNLYVDLRPIFNPAPYTIHMKASLPKTFQLFRGLGLRHLVVVDDNYEVSDGGRPTEVDREGSR